MLISLSAMRQTTFFLLTIALFLVVAGVAFFLDHPEVATGVLWGGVLGELNLRLLRWRITRLRPAGERSLPARLGIVFLFRYVVIILGIWFGYRVAGADVPATLAGLMLSFCLAVARIVRAAPDRRDGGGLRATNSRSERKIPPNPL